jgi:hypothetical protein
MNTTQLSKNEYSMESKMMLSIMNDKKIPLLNNIRIVIAAVSIMVFAFNSFALAESKQKTFSTGEDALNAFVKALKENNNQELLAIFGDDANDLISSGDEVADKQRREMCLKAYDEQHRLDADGNNLVIVVGKNDWPFPIPIIKQGQQWIFDTNAGKEEILNRRIGQNELDTIQVMLAIVDAQREYASKVRDGDGVRKYAQKLRSDPGKKNGLYWETNEGEEPSPLGPLMATARQEGYFGDKSSEKPAPYHGYYYRLLTSQGEHAEGGAYDYIVDGNMTGGFAVVAYPADYGNSGVMTFMVNYDGVVYRKNLGEETEQKAKAIKQFDPDDTWTKEK